MQAKLTNPGDLYSNTANDFDPDTNPGVFKEILLKIKLSRSRRLKFGPTDIIKKEKTKRTRNAH